MGGGENNNKEQQEQDTYEHQTRIGGMWVYTIIFILA